MPEKVKWGILSTARIGIDRLIPAIKDSEWAEVVALGSRDKAKAESTAQKLGIPRAYGSYQEVLEDPEVEAIYNPLPNSMHKEWTIKAAEAGKHILCEKPLAVNYAEAWEMVQACEKAGVLLMEAFMWRHHPVHTRVCEILAEGILGDLHLFRASFTFPLQAGRENIRLRDDLAGGALMDVGCYTINAARFLFNEEPIRAQAGFDMEPEFNVDTTFAGLLEFPHGKMALITASFRVSSPQEYEIAGWHGHLRVPSPFTPGERGGQILLTVKGQSWEEILPPVNTYRREVEHFCQNLREGKGLQPPAENGLANMRVIEAVRRSALENRAVLLEEIAPRPS